ncbi:MULTISPECIES: DUF2931 family protein [Pseudomonas]|uniref:Lipoprotein n=1 Tax=Pseudomonas chlororaphis O6 TaxID=1037915 RepID=A0AB33WQ37_9PSED|nr:MULTISPECIES: DUF2931 family protein [Pseudomonas]AZD85579.1 hypothetical protein C4K14_2755 [Pseudomonas chlororaphis subsp. aureofaciens]AZD92065.1 hypothetical protein C4K13_2648 [Pseudomonas chlororaphis subsp. aureofaciens]AZD98504.1 hypothetical protein C4K12_2638 [Pseudomonas chlororaphis subsp. aureofaciens]AZE04728.1 hypothetical protein C4K11_2566 [Pseudomonas chlororaphis subsp. aureofaciens]AZE10885.1 hypothetical protein C4K10_2605 [Pseudomonas chlororaphis subsp. aureofaciens]
MRVFIALLGALLLTGCQASDPLSGKNDPKDPWWELGFVEPYYMKVWVEDSAVEDVNGKLFTRTGGGSAAGGDMGYDKEWARGWSGGVGGNGKSVVGADLPKRIYVRWQSIVEPQTYRAWVDIPEEARKIMWTSTNRRCPETPHQTARYMASVYLGLAPGGIVQVWVRDECRHPVKVARAQAEVEPLGPDQGKNNGRYAYKVSEKSKRYIEKYGIPYDSW